jgi:hypothetical protein
MFLLERLSGEEEHIEAKHLFFFIQSLHVSD